MKFRITNLMISVAVLGLPMAAQVGGAGTTNRLPVWTGSSTLGDSNLFQSSGKFGIGNPNPGAMLDIAGKPGTPDLFGGTATVALRISGGLGATNTTLNGLGLQGAGGAIQIASGSGGSLNNHLATGGVGANLVIFGGGGADCVPEGSSRCNPVGGNGGSISLQPGAGGSSAVSSGQKGNVLLAPIGGHVGIASSAPTATLEVGPGHSTLADSWMTRSSRRFKTNIRPLDGALEKIQQLQGVSYERKDDGRHEIGVVAEDVDRIVPELVSRDPETKEVQGVDYGRLTALLIEAVKTQQAEIEHLKFQLHQITATGSGD